MLLRKLCKLLSITILLQQSTSTFAHLCLYLNLNVKYLSNSMASIVKVPNYFLIAFSNLPPFFTSPPGPSLYVVN